MDGVSSRRKSAQGAGQIHKKTGSEAKAENGRRPYRNTLSPVNREYSSTTYGPNRIRERDQGISRVRFIPTLCVRSLTIPRIDM